LQLSTLFVPMATRANFCVMKFTSFVAFEQLNKPKEFGPWAATASRNPAAARSSASVQLAGRKTPPSRTRGDVSRDFDFRINQQDGCLGRLPSK